MIPPWETRPGEPLGVVLVSAELLAGMLTQVNRIAVEVTHGLPAGARVVGCRPSEQHGAIELLVAGVEPGRHDIEFRTLQPGEDATPVAREGA